jgi:hypothetical protein
VREESHLDEMRQAIRGDFERLAERRGDQELMRLIAAEAADDETEEPAAEPEIEPQPESELEVEPDAEHEVEPPRRSWLSRMFPT